MRAELAPAIVALLLTIVDEGDKGSVEGALFQAMAENGFSYREYAAMMAVLHSQGLIDRRGNLAFPTEKGKRAVERSVGRA